MKREVLYLAFSFLFAISGYAKEWTLSDVNLNVKFDDQTAQMVITDKRCNKVWEQSVLKDKLIVKKCVQNENSLNILFKGKYTFNVVLTLSKASALEVTISANNKMPFEKVTFPTAFLTPNKSHYLLYTDGEGFLLPVDDTKYPIGRNTMYSMTGVVMPWMGVVDTDFQAGYMAIHETPNDSEINVVKDSNGLISFEPIWLSVKGAFGYTRKVTYHFFDKGGYVAQCKKYREFVLKNSGEGITLKEKQKQLPAIAKIVGAPHIYLWDDGREVAFAQDMKKAGIEKAFVLWNPNHLPYPEIGYDKKIIELGYCSGVYELFRDVHLRDTVGVINPENTQGTYLNRFRFPGLFNKITLIQKDGKLHYSGFGYDVNPKAILPIIPKLRTDREMLIYPHESFYLDGFHASGIFECYSKDNPLTRSEYKQSVVDMNLLFRDKYKQIVGVEWGADYCVPTSVYTHGITTLHRMLYPSIDRNKKGTIYYMGDWKNPSRPTIMIDQYVADKNYMEWAINEKIRVPLYQLVYHDAILTTWRWEDTNHHMPEIWWKKDLFNILYGTTPLWSLDRHRWEKFKETFIESYNKVCPWLQQIGYDEMVSHRFISSDHKVQESVFSSGKKVIVNFGDTDYTFENNVVKAQSFLTFTN